MSNIYSRITRESLWSNNIVFAQTLGLCPTMAVTSTATNGLGMGLATTAVLVASNMLISSIRHAVSDEVRIPVYIVIIATLVTLVDVSINAWAHDLYKVLGLYIALIVANCAVLGRAEAFAAKNPIL
ncbi:MAG: electron transport complex subunit RsxE, partial [Gallionella sp.]